MNEVILRGKLVGTHTSPRCVFLNLQLPIKKGQSNFPSVEVRKQSLREKVSEFATGDYVYIKGVLSTKRQKQGNKTIFKQVVIVKELLPAKNHLEEMFDLHYESYYTPLNEFCVIGTIVSVTDTEGPVLILLETDEDTPSLLSFSYFGAKKQLLSKVKSGDKVVISGRLQTKRVVQDTERVYYQNAVCYEILLDGKRISA